MATATVTPRAKRPPARPAATRARAAETRSALNMRIQPDLRDLIDQAAEANGKNRTDFVLDAARQAAQAALLDRVHVQLNSEAFAAFVRLIEAPAQPNAQLRKTLQTPAPWE